VAIRPIRRLGDPVLRTAAEPVTSFDAELRALVTDHLSGRLYLDLLRGETRRRALRTVRTADWAAPAR